MTNKIISIKDFQNLQDYKISLERDFIKARNGKDPNCRKCDEKGYLKDAYKTKVGDKEISFNSVCDCVRYDKNKIEEQLQRLNITIKQYRAIFGQLDENMTLDIYAKDYRQNELIEMFKNYLEVSSPASILLYGESKSGKTTILRLLWQIYAINKVNAFYLKASYFEKMYKQLYTSKSANDIQSAINSKIENAKKCDILLIDDLDSIGFATAKNGYYEIFDYLNRHDKKVIMTSNSYIEDILEKLKEKKDKDSIRMADKIISRMLGLGLIQLELKKYNPPQKTIIKRKTFENKKEA
ncbi:ATP-binding protein [Brachyspira sp.]|uniref:ATP-binding protein n=1 Tax=Brachyspira sp. TaxID=1977261 RepID=UPI003D7D40D6